jgi:ATP-dependent RNA helicase DDX56/DBP9
MKLFLDQFKIRSCVLNSELPANIRSHTVHEFNMGTYEIIIASDERTLSSKAKVQDGSSDYGVSRGIDFRCVSNVINFDFPTDVNSYIHRAGRTARGNNKGNVLSFISVSEKNLMDAVEEHLNASYGDSNLQIIRKHQFKIEDIEPFRYRAHDAWHAVTKSAIREARLKEIKREICNSEKLKSFFENSPRELQVFKHDAPLNIIKPIEHLSEVPEYIVPRQLKNVVGIVTKKHKNYQPRQIQKRKFHTNNPLAFDKTDKKRRKL